MAYFRCTGNSGGSLKLRTASGRIATFETNIADVLRSVIANIEATQSGSGTPYPEGGGRNLFGVKSRVNATVAQVVYTSDEDYFYLNGTKSGGGYADMANATLTLGAGTYYLRAFVISGTASGTVSLYAFDGSDNISSDILGGEKTMTLNDTTTFRFRFAIWADGTICTNYKVGIVVSKTSDIDRYYTYSNIRPIEGFTEANITRCGVNLFDKDGGNIINAYLSTKIEELAVCRTVYVKCNPSTQYTISKTAGQRFIVAYTKELPALNVPIYGAVQDGTASHITITTGADAKYIVAMVYNGNVDTVTADEMLASVQIAEGTETNYHAYNGQTYTIAFGQTVYGGVLDVTRGKLHVTWGICDLTDYNYTYNSTHGAFYTYGLIGTIKAGTANILCSHYKTNIVGVNVMNNYEISTVNSFNTGNVIIKDSDYTDAATFKTALGAMGAKLAYELATPFDIDLTPKVISAVVGTNNVFAGCGESTVKYLKRE